MTIGGRLSVWFSAVLVLALMGMGVLSYNEFVLEPRSLQEHGKKPENAFEELAEALTWTAAPALTLGLAGGWWLSRRAMRPVRALTQAAERITEHDFGARLPRTGSNDELDRLTDVFNEMTARLQQSFSRIREFTLHASHELKTPLTVMHTELETALSRTGLSAEERDRLASQLDEVQRLSRIVDGLTLLTKAGAGQIKLAPEPVRLEELVTEAVQDAQTLGASKQLQVVCKPCEAVAVVGDRHRLRQLLLNLTDNAVKYNRPGGMITFSVTREGRNARIQISNTGDGIEEAELPNVFEPFFRGQNAQALNGASEGSGLGLSIARWIAQAHAGTIEIKSGADAVITVSLQLPLLAEVKS